MIIVIRYFTLKKIRFLENPNATRETLLETLKGFRKGFRSSEVFPKIPFRFPTVRKLLGF